MGRRSSINSGDADLNYYVIADHPVADMATYPDSPGKWAIKPPHKCFTMTETHYYEPEE